MVGCKDNGTGTDPGEPPSIPDLLSEEASMDVSYFEENNPQKLVDQVLSTTNFTAAKTTVLTYSGIFESNSMYEGFLNPASTNEPTFNDGVWEWTYSHSFQGSTIEIRTTAEESNDQVQWAMYWTIDDGQGTSFDNYKLFEGTVSKDGSEGEWRLNSLNPDTGEEQLAMQYNWEVISDTEKTLSAQFYDDSGALSATIDYEKNQPEHLLVISSTDRENDFTVFWNTDTQEGYYKDGETQCSWNENFQDTSCTE